MFSGFGFLSPDRQVPRDGFADFRHALGSRLYGAVVLLDLSLHLRHGYHSPVAATGVTLAAKAIEMVVEDSLTVAGVADPESAAARATEDAALQIVMVGALLLAGMVMGG